MRHGAAFSLFFLFHFYLTLYLLKDNRVLESHEEIEY